MTEATTPQISTTTLPPRTPRVVIPAPQPSSPAQLRQFDATIDDAPTPASEERPSSTEAVSGEALAAKGPQGVHHNRVEGAPKKRGRKPKAESAPAPGQPPTPFGFRRRVVVDAPEHRFGTPGSSHEYVVELDAATEVVTLSRLQNTGATDNGQMVDIPVAELRELVAWSTALLAMLDGNG